MESEKSRNTDIKREKKKQKTKENQHFG